MINYKKGTKFNDVLTQDIIGDWNNNIILDGATGSGKTYFIEHNMYKYCQKHLKSLLFLCNRSALYDELLLEKEKMELYGMDMMLYQTLQSKILDGEEIKHYDYIVCDEIHYVLTDSLFNIYTDITYDWLKNETNSIKIFMSGTGGNIFHKLIEDKIITTDNIYRIPYDYSYAKLKYYYKKIIVYDIINHILNTTDEKIIYFANSLPMAKSVYKQFKEDSVFRCSKNVKDEEAIDMNNTDCIKAFTKDLITFENRLLVTTKALDNGVNIKDRKVKHIICDIFDLDSAQQCLGRKRKIDNEDTVTFYIIDYDKKALGNFKGGLHTKLNPVDLLVTNEKEFNDIYECDRKFHSDYIYYKDGIRQYNKLAYWKMKSQDKEIEKQEENGFLSEFLSHLGSHIEASELEPLEEYKMKDEFQLYLQDLVGKKLLKEEQDELKNMFEKHGLKARNLGINTLNGYLQDNNISYKIIAKRTKKERYWTIENNIDWNNNGK